LEPTEFLELVIVHVHMTPIEYGIIKSKEWVLKVMLFGQVFCYEVINFVLTFNVCKGCCTISSRIIDALLDEVALTGVGSTSKVKA
jgi:hypothetical protein